MELVWGQVTSVSPVQVRFAGDSVDTPVGWKSSGLTLSTSDKVLLGKAGTVDGWVIVSIMVAT
jgi:hypothetical protein